MNTMQHSINLSQWKYVLQTKPHTKVLLANDNVQWNPKKKKDLLTKANVQRNQKKKVLLPKEYVSTKKMNRTK